MPDELQLSVDEVDAALREIVPAVESGFEQLDDAREAVAAAVQQLGEASSAHGAALADFAAEANLRHSEIQQAATALKEFGDRLAELLRTAGSSGDNAATVTDELRSEVEASATSAAGEVREAGDALRERSDELLAAVADAETTLEGAQRELEGAINDCVAAVHDAESNLGQRHDELHRNLEEHSQAVQQELEAAIESMFGELTTAVDDRIDAQMQDKLSSLAENLSGLSDDAVSEIESLASELRERLGAIVEATQTHVEDGVKTSMQEAFDKLINECLSAFAEELVESIAMTQVGVATTSTLSPIIPELVVIEKALSAIKNFL